jgi:hypothetical protein
MLSRGAEATLRTAASGREAMRAVEAALIFSSRNVAHVATL